MPGEHLVDNGYDKAAKEHSKREFDLQEITKALAGNTKGAQEIRRKIKYTKQGLLGAKALMQHQITPS